ncbi:MAG: hypothetical protein WBK91_10930 [Alphaproteobacteria bacterium]
MSKDIYVKLKKPVAGEIYQEVVRPGQSENPTVRAFVDNGAHVTLVRASEINGVSPKDSSILGNVLRLSDAEKPRRAAHAPGVKGYSRNLQKALAL